MNLSASPMIVYGTKWVSYSLWPLMIAFPGLEAAILWQPSHI